MLNQPNIEVLHQGITVAPSSLLEHPVSCQNRASSGSSSLNSDLRFLGAAMAWHARPENHLRGQNGSYNPGRPSVVRVQALPRGREG